MPHAFANRLGRIATLSRSMQTAIFFVIIVLLAGVAAEDIGNDKVKLAFIDALKQVKASPEKIKALEQNWDGSLPNSVREIKEILQKVGVSDQASQVVVDGLTNIAKNKDNHSWLTHYGNLLIQVCGADKSLVEKVEQGSPDSIPTDFNVVKEDLKKVGFPDENAQGHAKILLWLREAHI